MRYTQVLLSLALLWSRTAFAEDDQDKPAPEDLPEPFKLSIIAKTPNTWVEGDPTFLKTEKAGDDLGDCEVSDVYIQEGFKCIGLLTKNKANAGPAEFTIHMDAWVDYRNCSIEITKVPTASDPRLMFFNNLHEAGIYQFDGNADWTGVFAAAIGPVPGIKPQEEGASMESQTSTA